MSYGASSLVWHHSKASGTDLLVLMAIANYISDEGAWPKVETIANDARTSVRQAHRSLVALRELGEITWDKGQGSGSGVYKTSRYWITLTCPDDCSGDWNHTLRQNVTSRPDKLSPLDLTHTADKPVIEPVKEPIRRASQISENYQPSETLLEWAKTNTPTVDVRKQTQMFINYYIANQKPMKNWDAAWRNWMLKSMEFEKPVWEKAKDVQAVESRLASERSREVTAELIEMERQAAELASPPPVCEHGKILALCLPCAKRLN